MFQVYGTAIRALLVAAAISPVAWGATPSDEASGTIVPVPSATAEAQGDSKPPADAVRTSLDELHSWLAASPHGEGWRRYLRSSELEAELARGDKANPVVLGDIVARYHSGKTGLHDAPFEKVRVALAAYHAQPATALENLAAFIAQGKGAFVPVSDAAAQAARRELAQAVANLQNFLASDPAKAAGWSEYLGLAEIAAQAAEGAQANPAQLATLHERFRRDVVGLEYAPFVAVRAALAKYAGLAAAAADPQLKQAYDTRLDDLARLVTEYGQQPTAGNRDAIANHLGWLARSSQSPTLISQVRRQFAQPNLQASISASFLAQGMNDGVDRVEPISDCILGTSITGSAHTTGYTQLVLVPCAHQAHLQVKLVATAHSNNTGYNRGVTLCTTGTTSICAHKNLCFDAFGLVPGSASASCSTSTSINDIIAKRAIIERIAWKKSSKSKGQAEAIASDHAEDRVIARMNREGAEKAAEANARYHEKFRDRLVRKGEFPEQFAVSSTTSAVLINMLKAGPDMLAASDAPHPLSGTNHDVAAQVHESFIGNFAAGLIGGVTWTKYKMDQDAEKVSGKKPEEAYDYDWEMTFASRERRPVTVAFREGEVDIVIRVQKFIRDNEPGDRPASEPIPANKEGLVEIDALLEIGATYSVELTGEGPLLKRKDRVRVDDPEGKLKGLQVAKKGAVRATFEDRFFKEEMRPQGIALNQGRWAGKGKLVARELRASQGWLNIGWQLSQPASATPSGNAAAAAGEPASAPAAVPVAVRTVATKVETAPRAAPQVAVH